MSFFYLDNIGTQTVGGRTDMPGVTRSGQYKYSSAVRNPQQVITVPAPMTRLQVLLSVLCSLILIHTQDEKQLSNPNSDPVEFSCKLKLYLHSDAFCVSLRSDKHVDFLPPS